MKQKLEIILALDSLLELAVWNINKANPGSELSEKWIGRRDKIVIKLEEAWNLVEAECDCGCDRAEKINVQPEDSPEA
jgi:hypothetical protein